LEWRGAASTPSFHNCTRVFHVSGGRMLIAATIQKIMAIFFTMANRGKFPSLPLNQLFGISVYIWNMDVGCKIYSLSLGWTQERPKYSTTVSFPTQLRSRDCSGLSLYPRTALFVLYPVKAFHFVFVFSSDIFFFVLHLYFLIFEHLRVVM